MAEPEQQRDLDPVGRQVDALKLLERLVAGRVEAEARVDRERNARVDAAERAHQQATRATAERYEKDRAALDRRAAEEPEAARAAFEKAKADAEKALRIARAEAERKLRETTETVKKAQADQRWEVGTLCEASLNDAKAAFEKAQNRLAEVDRRLRALRDEATAVLAARRMGSVDGQASEPAAVGAEAEAPSVDAANAALDEAEGAVGKLAGLPLPGLFRGARPVVVAALLIAAGAVAGGFMKGWTVGAAVGGGAGLVLAVALLAALFFVAREQARRAVGPLRASIDRAVDQVNRARAHESTAYRRREEQLLRDRDREQHAADERAKAALLAARKAHDATVAAADAAARSALAKAEAARDELIRRVEAEVAEQGPALDRRFEADRDRHREDHERNLAAARDRHDAERAALTKQWRDGLARVRDELAAAEAVVDACFPSWADAADPAHAGGTAVPPALPIGRLRVDLDMFPNGRPDDPALMEGLPDRFEPPAIVRSPDACSLLLRTDAEGRPAALKELQATMLRLLTGFPPGKARFTMIDPVGLGATFAAFMHLADSDEQLVTSRVWTEAAHIEQRLQDLTEHMENVIQKYLRNEYRSITEYNARAGEVAEPFRFLVVADFPVRFNEAAARRLVSIAQSGPRCGVHVLMTVDSRQELPQGIDLKDLERHAAVLHWREGRFRWQDPDQGVFPLALDEPPESDRFSAIVRAAGKRAEGASTVRVPFEFLAPEPGHLWERDSASSLAIPLGRAGATKVQNLKLGTGTDQHVLIAGKTGSGKSTLLHAMITSAALFYNPDQVQLYLIDFKKGVEFKPYATHRLPHARVIAVESEREFGLSVLQRLDEELKTRGDLFRDAGTQDVAAFRKARPDRPMPRILLIVDEFQEFFVEDDKVAQEAALLLDRLVRQGRAFGIHVLLGSQTLAGAYTLARATIGQMAVRIALQCSESDASLILSDENTAARLLSRPGEAIYNDANGRLEGNSVFQVVWLPDEQREGYLRQVAELTRERGVRVRPPIVFEGSTAPDPANNEPLMDLIDADSFPDPLPKAASAWLGEPVAIKAPTAMTFRRLAGSHLLIVGQNEEAAVGLMATSILSLAAHRPDSRIVLLDGTPSDDPRAGDLARLLVSLPVDGRLASWGQVESSVAEVAAEVERRRDEGQTDGPPIYLLIYDLQRFRQLRKAEDDYSFSSPDPDEPPKPSERLGTILRDGPVHGVHAMIWCDTLNTLNRTFDRATLRELEHRVLFQMSTGDSSTLIDSPLANRLGMRRALFVSEEAGLMEKFRPYGPPSADWLADAARRLRDRRPAGPATAEAPSPDLADRG